MDPRDRGAGVEPSSEKAARAWRPMVHEPERWVGKGLPAAVERLMTWVQMKPPDIISMQKTIRSPVFIGLNVCGWTRTVRLL